MSALPDIPPAVAPFLFLALIVGVLIVYAWQENAGRCERHHRRGFEVRPKEPGQRRQACSGPRACQV
jgi:hypothetical protein